MADASDRFSEALDQLDHLTRDLTPEEAGSSFDEATLQRFWREWPHLSGWAGALWRSLNADLEQPAQPVIEEDLDEVGGAG